MEHDLRCAECDASFTGRRSDARFCSHRCWNQNYRRRDPEQDRRSHARRRDDVNARRRTARATDPERHRAYDRVRHERDKVRRNALRRARYAQDPERRRRAVADWRRSNRDIVAELLRVQKAVRRGAERRRVTARDLARLLDRHRGRCAYCAVPVVPGTSLHWDHIIPIIRGGRHAIGNLAPACPTCNTRKGALTVMEWRIRVY